MDDVARAVGAGEMTPIVIAGKQCTVRPLGVRELSEVERDCLKRYKRAYLESYYDNMDLLPAGTRDGLMQQKVEDAARWDIDDLPGKTAYNPLRVVVTAELRKWLEQNFDLPKDADDLHARRLAAAVLDQELLTEPDYEKLAGSPAPKVRVGYVNWWTTGSFDGMITFAWACFKHDGITRDQVLEELGKNMNLLVQLTRDIERLSMPAAGNG